MSVKIVIFGESEQVDKFLEKSLGGQPISNQDEAISVENVTRGESPYLLFAVRERALVSEQATGTNGTFGITIRTTFFPWWLDPTLPRETISHRLTGFKS